VQRFAAALEQTVKHVVRQPSSVTSG